MLLDRAQGQVDRQAQHLQRHTCHFSQEAMMYVNRLPAFASCRKLDALDFHARLLLYFYCSLWSENHGTSLLNTWHLDYFPSILKFSLTYSSQVYLLIFNCDFLYVP